MVLETSQGGFHPQKEPMLALEANGPKMDLNMPQSLQVCLKNHAKGSKHAPKVFKILLRIILSQNYHMPKSPWKGKNTLLGGKMLKKP